MARFIDRVSDDWRLTITIGDLAPLREAGFDTSKAFDEPKAVESALRMDPETLGRALWVLCEDQAAIRNLDPKAFARRFDGRTIAAAVDAVLEALVDFHHRPGQQADAVKAAVASAVRGTETATARAFDAAKARIEAAVASTSNEPAGNSPASSGSTPAP